jgi:GTPase SAR1 family protein
MFKVAVCLLWVSLCWAEASKPKQELNILFVGKTQSGKSSLVNIFYNHIIGKKYEEKRAIVVPLRVPKRDFSVNVKDYEAYNEKVRGLNESQTKEVHRYTAANDRYIVHLWDAPGFNDTDQKITDEEIVKKIAVAIGETSFNAIAFVLRPNEPATFDMRANINRIRTMLPKTASKNIIGIYSRAYGLSSDQKEDNEVAFAGLFKINPGEPMPRVYSIDGSSFFDRVNLNDEKSLMQGQDRWFNDGVVVTTVLMDIAGIKPFDAADVLKIQNTLDEIEQKIETRKTALDELDKTVDRIKALKKEHEAAEKKRDDNQKYNKEQTLTIEKEVMDYKRRWYTLWLKKHEAGMVKEHHQGTAKYTDEDQKALYLQAVGEIDKKKNLIGVEESKKEDLSKEEQTLLEDLVRLEKERRAIALSSDLDSFIVYLNRQIKDAEKDPDENNGKERKKILEERRNVYLKMKEAGDLGLGDL